MKYNGELSVIDTQEKAYLLGQLYGDGCVFCKTGMYKTTMASIDTDTEVYKRLAELFPFFKLKTYKSHSNMIYLENFEKNLCLDLKKIGLLAPKTKTDKTGEFHFPNLQEDLIPHFIRGYFDADGSAYLPARKRSRNNLKIEFGCATRNFLLKLKEVLETHDIHFTWYERDKKAGNGKYYYSCCIMSSSREMSLKFADFIYKNAMIYLPRKHEICYKEPEYRPTVFEIYGACPYCGGNHLIRRSFRITRAGKMQRILCKDCYKMFQKPMPTPEVTQDA